MFCGDFDDDDDHHGDPKEPIDVNNPYMRMIRSFKIAESELKNEKSDRIGRLKNAERFFHKQKTVLLINVNLKYKTY